MSSVPEENKNSQERDVPAVFYVPTGGKGKDVFKVTEKTCNALCDSISGFVPSFKCAKAFENINLILRYDDKIGNLFQRGERDDKYGATIDPISMTDSIVLESAMSLDAFCNDDAIRSKSFDPTAASATLPSGMAGYDFSKCYVETIEVIRYENGFPFHFYMGEDFASKLATDSPLVPYITPPLLTDDVIAEGEEEGPKAGDVSPPPPIYLFKSHFGIEEAKEHKFPHCVYQNTKTSRFNLTFGCTNVSQITNGIVKMGPEMRLDDEETMFVGSTHAFHDVILSICRRDKKIAVGLTKEKRKADGKVLLESVEEAFSTFVETGKLPTDDLRYKIDVIDAEFNKIARGSDYKGFFCPFSSFERALRDYMTVVHPMVSKTCDLSRFMRWPLTYYKNGASFDDYVVPPTEEDTVERFNERYLPSKKTIEVHLRLSLMVFPKGHSENESVMCCDM
jgi:hypothetical protein